MNGGYTPETVTAVENFQAARGLTVDGIVGPDTWNALPAEDLQGIPVLKEGSSGGAVALLQRCLRRHGYDSGYIDGIFRSGHHRGAQAIPEVRCPGNHRRRHLRVPDVASDVMTT